MRYSITFLSLTCFLACYLPSDAGARYRRTTKPPGPTRVFGHVTGPAPKVRAWGHEVGPAPVPRVWGHRVTASSSARAPRLVKKLEPATKKVRVWGHVVGTKQIRVMGHAVGPAPAAPVWGNRTYTSR